MTGKHVKKTDSIQKRGRRGKRTASGTGAERNFDTQCMNHEHEKLVQWLKTVKFRKVLFGGVDEVQLWKKLEELNRLYEAAISAERARYDTLIRAYTEQCNAEIRRYQQASEGTGAVPSGGSQSSPVRGQREERM